MSGPALSVVLVTDRRDWIRKTLAALRAQTVAGRVELVVVAPEHAGVELAAADVAGLHSHRVVTIPQLGSVPWARAPGVLAATAPVVALAETHSYPEPDWAERLLAAHENGWAAVGPAVGNANPDSRLSWANMLLDYGRWLYPTTGGELDDLPGHNSSYKRDLLVGYGSGLEAMLEFETVLHRDLRRRGHRLYQEPSARISHLNVTRPSSWLVERFESGRLFAAARSRAWSRLRRAAYTVGAPLIPLVRLPRLARDVRRTGVRLGALGYSVLGASLVVSAAGELAGYAAGRGDALRRLLDIELDREGHQRGARRARG